MEEPFVPSSQNSSVVHGEVLRCHEDLSSFANSGRERSDDIPSQVLRKSDTATLIGVVERAQEAPTAPGILKWKSLQGLSNDQLMIAVAQGECLALEELYDRYVRICFGLALSIVHEPTVAEEVVQEAFIKVWSRPEAFSPERGTFRLWLFSVVRNGSLDRLRQAKSRSASEMLDVHLGSADSETPVELLPDTGPTPHDQVWTEEVRSAVQHALGQLPVSEYQAIELAYFGDLSQREVADKLQKPLGTIKSRTRSGLRRLQRILVAHSSLSD